VPCCAVQRCTTGELRPLKWVRIISAVMIEHRASTSFTTSGSSGTDKCWTLDGETKTLTEEEFRASAMKSSKSMCSKERDAEIV
jgi:hypothetical protein